MLQLRKLGWGLKQIAHVTGFSTKTVGDYTKQEDRRNIPYYEAAITARELLREGKLRPVEIAKACGISLPRVCAIKRKMK